MHSRTRKAALTEGIIAGVLFGTAAIFIRYLENLDTFSIAFWRLIIACLVLATMLLILKSFSFSLVRKNVKDLVILSFFLGLHFIFFVSAVKDTTILNATVLVNTTPIFSMLVSILFLKLLPPRIAVFGLAISFAGVCVIAYAQTVIVGEISYSGHRPSFRGDLAAVGAAVVEAFYLNYGRKVRSQMNVLYIMPPLYLLTAGVVGVLSLPVRTQIFALSIDMPILLSIIGLAIFPTAIAHTLYFSSLSSLKSFETASMALLEPIGATILGISLFQEMPAPLFVLGAILILAGIFFVVKGEGVELES